MTLLIKLEHDGTGVYETFVDGSTVAGITILKDGTYLGTPVENPMYSRTMDSLGVTVTGASREAREQQLAFLVEGDTVAELQGRLDRFSKMAELVSRKGGGTLHYRSAQGTKITRFKVAAAKVLNLGDITEYESMFRQRIVLAMVVDPLGLAASTDILDTFASNTLGTGGIYNPSGSDYTLISGVSTPSIAGGVMTTPTTTGNNQLLHTGTGNTYSDVQISTKVEFDAAISNGKYFGHLHTFLDTSNYLGVRASSNGAGAGNLILSKVIAGVATDVATTAITTLAADTFYWVRSRVEGNTLTAEWFTAEPTPLLAPTHTVSYTLTAAEAAVLGSAIRGQVGIRWNTNGTGGFIIDDFDVEAFTYRNATLPAVLRLNGTDNLGTSDARAAVWYTSSGSAPQAMMLSWWEKPDPHNYVWNGGGEVWNSGAATTAYGWGIGAVAGLTAAATSVNRITSTFKSGSAAFQAVTTATLNSGINFPIYRKGGFRKGVTYTASAIVRSGTHTTSVKIGIYNSAGITGSSAAAALQTSWNSASAIFTFTFIPTADLDVAYFAIRTEAAAITQFEFDDVMVYEGTVAPALNHGGFGPGIVPAVSYDSARAAQSTDGTYWAIAADATYHSGFRARGTGAMGSTANLEYHILPHLFAPDEFTKGEIDIAVYARCAVTDTQLGLAASVSVVPEDGTAYGAAKLSEFYGQTKTLRLPGAGTYFKPYYLGTVTVRVDKRNPSRVKLRVSFINSGSATGTFGVDYLILAPSKNIATSRTGVLAGQVPSFIGTTNEITKVVNHDLSVMAVNPASNVSRNAMFPDSSLLLNKMLFPNKETELLVFPSTQVIDAADVASINSMSMTHVATVHVELTPQVHLLKQ